MLTYKAPKPRKEGKRNYVEKAAYGKVPKYLKTYRKKKRQRDAAIGGIKAMEQQKATDQKAYELKKIELIRGNMRRKWDELNAEYQRTSHAHCTSVKQRQDRSKLEKQLDKVEKDMKNLEDTVRGIKKRKGKKVTLHKMYETHTKEQRIFQIKVKRKKVTPPQINNIFGKANRPLRARKVQGSKQWDHWG